MCARYVKSQQDEEALFYANELLKAVNLNLNSNGFLNEKVALDLCRKIRKLLTIYEKIEIQQNSEIFSVLQKLNILQRQLTRLQELSNLNRITTDTRVRLYGVDTFRRNQFLVQLDLVRLRLSPSLTDSRNTIIALFQDKEKAVGIARSILEEEHPEGFLYNIVYSFLALAELYVGLWRFDDAIPLCLEALEILDSIPLDRPFALNPLGWDRSADESTRSLLIMIDKQTGLQLLGKIYMLKSELENNLEKKREYYEFGKEKCIQSLELLKSFQEDYPVNQARTEPYGLLELSIYYHLGILHLCSGFLEEAREASQNYMRIISCTQNQQFAESMMPEYLKYSAILEAKHNNYEQAEQKLREALTTTSRIAILKSNCPTKVSLFNTLAVVLSAQNRHDEALQYAHHAISMSDKLFADFLYGFSESYHLNYISLLRETNGDLDCLLTLVWRYFHESANQVNTAANLVFRRKALTASASGIKNQAVYNARYPHLSEDFLELQTLERKITRLTATSSSPSQQQQLSQLKNNYEQLQWKLASKIPEMQLEQDTEAINVQIVSEKLPNNSVLIEFVRFEVLNVECLLQRELSEFHYLAFILPAKHPDKLKMIDLGEASEIDSLIEALRRSASDNQAIRVLDAVRSLSEEENSNIDTLQKNIRHERFSKETIIQERQYAAQAGINLSQKLLDDILPALEEFKYLFDSEVVEQLILAPDSNLNLLPFGILPIDSEGETLLIDRYTISYLTAARDIMRLKIQANRPTSEPLIIADPDFELANSQTRDEVANNSFVQSLDIGGIRDLLDVQDPALGTRFLGQTVALALGAEANLGADALASMLMETRNPAILMIATHGVYLNEAEDPMLSSGLAFAGANTWLRDNYLPQNAGIGYVFAQDIAKLDLWATELVILSACNTGVGSITRSGEGVFGLRRAFALAGAKSIVMSLWSVPAKVTSLFMVRFLENLQSGELGKAEALKEAQHYIHSITVGELLDLETEQGIKLGIEVLEELAGLGGLTAEILEDERDIQPLQHPFYWAAWICQGDNSLANNLVERRRILNLCSSTNSGSFLENALGALFEDGEREGQWTAYCLLEERTEEEVKKALRRYLSSVGSVDYNQLRNYLKQQEWRNANAETVKSVYEIGRLEQDSFKTREYLLNLILPDEDLWVIDKLWTKYSGGHFGFTAQKSVLLDLGVQPGNLQKEVWKSFCQQVCWMKENKFKIYDELTFSCQEAKKGHLPILLVPMSRTIWSSLLNPLLLRDLFIHFRALQARLIECDILGREYKTPTI